MKPVDIEIATKRIISHYYKYQLSNQISICDFYNIDGNTDLNYELYERIY